MNAIASRAREWMRSERSDASGQATVSGRRIYILPTRYGLLFAVLMMLMLLGALNYDNNPAYLLTFFLVAVALNAMYQTWRNLRGVQARMLSSEAVFCGQDVTVRFQLGVEDGEERPAIQVQIDDYRAIDDLPASGDRRILALQLPTGRRGWFYPGRLTLSTQYPLGLYRAWCYIELSERILVYPRLGARDDRLVGGDEQQQGNGSARSGQEDFFGLRDYRRGDSPRLIDWNSLARERGVMSKQFTTPQGHPRLIDWHALAGNDSEQKISLLARAVVDADMAGEPFALRLPGQTLDAAQGPAHRHACLAALACFEDGSPP